MESISMMRRRTLLMGSRAMMTVMRVALSLSLLLFMAQAVRAQTGQAQSVPPSLQSWEIHLPITQSEALDRAAAAIRAAEMKLSSSSGSQEHPVARGGYNSWSSVLIVSRRFDGKTVVDIVLSTAAGHNDYHVRLGDFLVKFMKGDQSPNTGGGSGSGNPRSGHGSFTGVWMTEAGGVRARMSLTQDGDSVSGTYDYQGGRVAGKVIGKVLRFNWFQSGDKKSGTGTFILSDDGNTFTGHWSHTSDPDNKSGGGWNGTRLQTQASGGTTSGGVCADPRTLTLMDEWLAQANPPHNQQPGWSVRYESWGRLVGKSPSAALTVSGSPTTSLSRCEWLWYYAAGLRSTNRGTLKEYVEQRR